MKVVICGTMSTSKETINSAKGHYKKAGYEVVTPEKIEENYGKISKEYMRFIEEINSADLVVIAVCGFDIFYGSKSRFLICADEFANFQITTAIGHHKPISFWYAE